LEFMCVGTGGDGYFNIFGVVGVEMEFWTRECVSVERGYRTISRIFNFIYWCEVTFDQI